METTQNIDRYLNQEMSATERENFELELNQNAVLQRELDTVRMIKKAVQTTALRAQVKQVHEAFIKDYEPEKVLEQEAKIRPLYPQRGRMYRGISVAAAVVAILVLVGGYQYASLNGETLYQDKFLPYKLPTMRSQNVKESALDSLYATGNFAAVITQIQPKKIKQPQDLFLLAMAHLNQKQFTQALVQFEALKTANAQRGVKYFEAEADYYEALALVGEKRYEEALDIFEKIYDDPTHLFHANVSQWDLWQLRMLSW